MDIDHESTPSIPHNSPQCTPKQIEKLWELANSGGAGIAQICHALGIGSFSTFYSYKRKIPEFREAVEACKMARCSSLEEAIFMGAVGQKKIDSKAAMWALYNQDHDEYEMPGMKSQESSKTVNVKIGNINMANLTKMSGEELDRLIAQTETSIKAIELTQLPEITSSATKEGANDE